MLYKLMVMLHLLGASAWVGGHAVLMIVVLPRALRHGEPQRIIDFERGYGRLGLAALIVQLATGLWLSVHWTGGLGRLFLEPTPHARLILLKLGVLAFTVAFGGYAYHRALPRVERGQMRLFTACAGLTTLLAVALLVLGVAIRTGGLY